MLHLDTDRESPSFLSGITNGQWNSCYLDIETFSCCVCLTVLDSMVILKLSPRLIAIASTGHQVFSVSRLGIKTQC